MAFNLSGHFRAAYRRGANLNVFPIVHEQDAVELDLFAFLSVQSVDEHLLVFLYLVLVPCDLYDCIHDSCIYSQKRGCKGTGNFSTFQHLRARDLIR